jgi:SAM-dependent methyltransferase
MDAERLARIPEEIPRWRVAYWEYQRDLCQRDIVPFLRARGALDGVEAILEVGCAEAGCLTALAKETDAEAVGVELSDGRFEFARAINEATDGPPLELRQGDITLASTLEGLEGRFDLVLLRDVIEHIEHPDLPAALDNCARTLKPGGHMMVTFPPYYSPFGAHQQVLSRRPLQLPWIQLSPAFLPLVERFETRDGNVREMKSLARCSLTLRRFERAVRESPLDIVAEEHFLLRPAFRDRYGLPVVRSGPLGRVPLVRELVSTASWFLMRK